MSDRIRVTLLCHCPEGCVKGRIIRHDEKGERDVGVCPTCMGHGMIERPCEGMAIISIEQKETGAVLEGPVLERLLAMGFRARKDSGKKV